MLRMIVTCLLCLSAVPAAAQTKVETDQQTVLVFREVSDLVEPWALGFLPDGSLLVTERGGQLLHIAEGTRRAIANVPDVHAEFQGGLLDLLVPSDFADTQEIFFTYAQPQWFGRSRTALARAVLDLEAGALRDVEVLFTGTSSKGEVHYGSRVVEAADGTLFMTLGERGSRDAAQDPGSYLGKVVRVTRTGEVPDDNPDFPGEGRSEVWSIGHRNAQGAALDASGRLWIVDHGDAGGDELNRPEAGRNYGWPVISFGRHYDGETIGVGTEAPGMEQPVHYWDPSIAPSGLMIYSGELFPEWQGDIFVGGLALSRIARLEMDGDRVVAEETLFEDTFIRIRDIREAPDGAIWFLSVGDGAAYRMTPG